ncbi:MAG TPA: FAD-dependent oxidoreductase, partial [Polyangiales bacterium]|nr:FAD-dependent oxidoreductase [Polyangiales bacterium]
MKPERMHLEEGAAFLQLMGLDGDALAGGGAASAAAQPERFDAIVIGGGQAGLSVGYHLAKQGLSFVILDGSARIGDAWRKRWDSLRLFSPRHLDGLDGMPFPGSPRGSFPTKDEMADYLEAYAARFALPVRSGLS